MVCRGLSGERLASSALPRIPKCKDTGAVRERSLPTVKSPYRPSAEPWIQSINSVFRWGRRNLFSLLFTNLDQVSNNLFLPQKRSDFGATLKRLWWLWKLPQQLSTPGRNPLTAAGRFARKRKLTSYLLPNLKGSFSFTFYFLEGEGRCCRSELCRLATPVCALKTLAAMAVAPKQGEPAPPSLPPVAAAARHALIYSNDSRLSAVSH